MTALAYLEVNDGDASRQDRRFDDEDPRSMSRPRRVLGYARVSSAEQALGTSLGDQQEAIRAYAKARGLKVDRFYVEAESAVHEKIERREQIRALLRDAKRGDLVICDKLDRWSRDTEFTLRSVRELRERGSRFYSVADQCDPETRDGDMMLTMRAMFAKEEHRRIKERMVGTRRLLRDRGYYAEGTPPLGYRRQAPKGTKDADKNVLVVVPAEAELVRKIFRRYISGRSMAKVAGDLGLKRDRVNDVLHRRVYLGEVQTTRGEWMRARHEPIIDAVTFAKAHARIDAARLGGPRVRDVPSETSTWILRDVARCLHCDAKMSAAYAGPKDERRRHYYKCSKLCHSLGSRANHGGHVPVREVEEVFAPLVIGRLTQLRDDIAKGPEEAIPSPTKDFASKRLKLQRKRESYIDSCSDGFLSRDELRERMAKLDAELLKLDAQEQAESVPSPLASPAIRRDLLREVKMVHLAWKKATPQERREFVNLLASSVKVAREREPVPAWRSAEDLAAEVQS